MSLPDVLQRGSDFLNEYPRQSLLWRYMSYGTCWFTIGVSKLFLGAFYNVKLNHFEKLEHAIDRSAQENRGLVTVMNHMSVVDDPFVWATFPWRTFKSIDNFRWCLGAQNICFKNTFFSTFFSLGQVLSTQRFGAGPFQGSIDACVRLLSPEVNGETHLPNAYSPYRKKPAWVHVYPEGFVLQLQPPFANSMRYFKWGITRMILEAKVAPIVVPIFTTGFEKIAPEEAADDIIDRFIPRNFGAEINVTIGDPINDSIIDSYRKEWQELVLKYTDPKCPTDLSDKLKYGQEAQDLRKRVAAELRLHVSNIRHNERHLPQEDPRFQSAEWWKKYTQTEGTSDPDVQFIGKNWAIKRLQDSLNEPRNEGKKD